MCSSSFGQNNYDHDHRDHHQAKQRLIGALIKASYCRL